MARATKHKTGGYDSARGSLGYVSGPVDSVSTGRAFAGSVVIKTLVTLL